MLGTFTLAELVPDLKQLSEAKGHSELVYEVIDQVLFIVYSKICF